MDNPERNESSLELRQWIEGCSALLAPPADWEPNLNAARVRFEARLHQRSLLRRFVLAGVTAALLVCLLVPAIPQARVFAQQVGSNNWYRVERFWNWITIVRTPLRFRLDGLPEALRTHPYTESGTPQLVSDVAEAAHPVGFIPRLPRSGILSGILSGRPVLSVNGPQSIDTVVSTADLELALRNAGVSDQDVPKEWDGARIALQIGATVTAEWPDVREEGSGQIEWSDLTLAQGLPPLVAVPPGFDLAAFTVLNLRTALLGRENALRFAQRATTAPALLFGKGRQNIVAVREVNLHKGPATLIEERREPGFGARTNWFGFTGGPSVERITLLWSVPDRMYVLRGVMSVPCEMISLDLAGALTNIIDLANTVE
jgi:hypothetical protein